MRGDKFTSQVKLGEKYRDTVSGFEGVATAVYFFLHGCERVTLERWMETAGEMRELTFDAPRLEHVETKKVMTSPRTGGYKADPPKKGPA